MSTTQVGNNFENKVFLLFKKLMECGDFIVPAKNSKIFQKKGYFSKQRGNDIIFDVVIETYLPDQETPSYIVFIECKNYSKKVPIDDLEEFLQKISQIAPCANKAILVTTNSFSDTCIHFAQSNHMGLVRIFTNDKIKWLVTRKTADVITYQNVEKAKDEVLKALCEEDYKIINNKIVFFNNEPIYDPLSFIDSVYNKNYVSHSSNPEILNWLYQGKCQNKNIEYLSDKELVELAKNFRNDLFYKYNNVQLNFDAEIIIRYLNDQVGFSVDFVDELHITKPYNYLAYIDYEDKQIFILNIVLQYEGRLKFTLVHELSHLLLHRQLLNDLKLNTAFLFLPQDVQQRIELQANKLTSFILLPPDKLKIELENIINQFKLNNNRGYYIYLDSQPCNQQQWFAIAGKLSDLFGVSKEVIKNRLQEINFLKIGKETVSSLKDLYK